MPTSAKVVAQIDPNLPLIQPVTQRAQFDTTIAQPMLFARLAGFFGLLAVLLVATGLYGVLCYRVNSGRQRLASAWPWASGADRWFG